MSKYRLTSRGSYCRGALDWLPPWAWGTVVGISVFLVILLAAEGSLVISRRQTQIEELQASVAALQAEIEETRMLVLQTQAKVIMTYKALDVDRQFLAFTNDLITIAQSRNSELTSEKIYDMSVAIWEASLRHNFDPYLLTAVIEHESNFNPKAVGGSGEIGLMQILPLTGRLVAASDGMENFNIMQLYDIRTNIRLGSLYLAQVRDHLRPYVGEFSELELALMAYNRGPGRVIQEVQSNKAVVTYSRAVIAGYERLQQD